MAKEFVVENEVSAPEGRRLKALMVLRGLRVEDVAATAGMGSQTLYRVLAGTRMLSEDERERLMAALVGGEA